MNLLKRGCHLTALGVLWCRFFHKRHHDKNSPPWCWRCLTHCWTERAYMRFAKELFRNDPALRNALLTPEAQKEFEN